jgi:hypothetical protein
VISFGESDVEHTDQGVQNEEEEKTQENEKDEGLREIDLFKFALEHPRSSVPLSLDGRGLG